MNWNSKSVSEVAKEHVEHVVNEQTKRQIFDSFRVDAAQLQRVAVSEPISRRPARFLDRDQAFLHTMKKTRSQTKKKTAPNRMEADDISSQMSKLHQTPREKYSAPQTTSQEMGWNGTPSPDKIFNFSLKSCDITRTAERLRK